jgi:NAD(P)-dependent dehydrogenase (short-subunit alcohol dehydrogenase family)
MSFDVAGKVALVTGSSTGIGRATAVTLAGLGAKVVVNYASSADDAAETLSLVEAAGGSGIVVQADVSDEDAVRSMLDRARNELGPISVLVNNAGTSTFVPFNRLDDLTDDIWESTYRTNVIAAYRCIRLCAPDLQAAEGGGAVVNVASIAGVMSIGSSLAYAASKAALINMTRGLARTLAPSVRVNAVAPGYVDSAWWERRGGMSPEQVDRQRAGAAAATPLQVATQPEEVAGLITWLVCGPGSGSVTGECVLVDGGLHLGQGPTRR